MNPNVRPQQTRIDTLNPVEFEKLGVKRVDTLPVKWYILTTFLIYSVTDISQS